MTLELLMSKQWRSYQGSQGLGCWGVAPEWALDHPGEGGA